LQQHHHHDQSCGKCDGQIRELQRDVFRRCRASAVPIDLPPNQTVLCNDTNWLSLFPTWTNTCCTNVIINSLGISTNWPTITLSWFGQACGVIDFCSTTISFADSNGLACDCLDIFCSSNIIVQTCLGTTAGGLTNIFWPPPTVTNYCIGNVTNIFCTPPSGSPFRSARTR